MNLENIPMKKQIEVYFYVKKCVEENLLLESTLQKLPQINGDNNNNKINEDLTKNIHIIHNNTNTRNNVILNDEELSESLSDSESDSLDESMSDLDSKSNVLLSNSKNNLHVNSTTFTNEKIQSPNIEDIFNRNDDLLYNDSQSDDN
jgi:hypothetical protein